MPSACIIPNCKSRKLHKLDNNSVSVFKVPKDEKCRKEWEEAIRSVIPTLSELKPRKVVCEKHFKKCDIKSSLKKYDKFGNEILNVSIEHLPDISYINKYF